MSKTFDQTSNKRCPKCKNWMIDIYGDDFCQHCEEFNPELENKTLHLVDQIRHRIHRRINRKYKHRDRNKGKPWNRNPNWIKRHSEKDYSFNRRKSHTETGFGVGYERNPDADKY